MAKKEVSRAIYYLLLISLFGACNTEEQKKLQGDFPTLTGNKEVYLIYPKKQIRVVGEAVFHETEKNSSVLTISINNIKSGEYHVAIYLGSYAEKDDEFISLGILDTDAGYFEIEIIEDGKGNTLLFNDLINLDGHIKLSGQFLVSDDTYITDIGVNELTGNSKNYILEPVEYQEASGKIEIYERKSRESMVRVTLLNKPLNNDLPVSLYSNSYGENSDLILNLNPIKPGKSFSDSHVSELKSGETVLYQDLINLNGHIRVHLGVTTFNIILAAGNIGSNTN